MQIFRSEHNDWVLGVSQIAIVATHRCAPFNRQSSCRRPTRIVTTRAITQNPIQYRRLLHNLAALADISHPHQSLPVHTLEHSYILAWWWLMGHKWREKSKGNVMSICHVSFSAGLNFLHIFRRPKHGIVLAFGFVICPHCRYGLRAFLFLHCTAVALLCAFGLDSL